MKGMNLRQLIREAIQERLSQYPIHLTLDDRDSTFERFGVVMSRNYTDPQMAIVRLKDGSEALAVWDINSNIVRLISSEKKKLGALLFKRDYANDTLTPASGVNNQTIQVDPESRRNGSSTRSKLTAASASATAEVLWVRGTPRHQAEY